MVICGTCGAKFSANKSLLRHEREKHGDDKFPCSFCDLTFSRKENAVRHVFTRHRPGASPAKRRRCYEVPTETAKKMKIDEGPSWTIEIMPPTPSTSRTVPVTPSTSTSAPSTSTSAPSTSTSAPSTSTSAPSTSTSAPSTSASAPSTSASAPSTSASAPSTSTSAPSTSTSTPSTWNTTPPATTSASSTTRVPDDIDVLERGFLDNQNDAGLEEFFDEEEFPMGSLNADENEVLQNFMRAMEDREADALPHADVATPDEPRLLDQLEEMIALRNAIFCARFTPAATETDAEVYINRHRAALINYLQAKLARDKGLKWYLTTRVRYVRELNTGEEVEFLAYHNSDVQVTLTPDTINNQIDLCLETLKRKIEDFQKRGSGWTIDRILFMQVNIITYLPLVGGTYIELPKVLVSKHAVVNIKNEDNRCFLWSVLAHLHPAKNNSNRVQQYIRFEDELDLSGITFPFELDAQKLKKFEDRNNISVNIFSFEKFVFPLYISAKRVEKAREIDLLLITKGEKKHYTLIRSLSRLLSDFTKHNGTVHYCRFCLHRFAGPDSEVRCDIHAEDCRDHGAQKILMPVKEPVLEFKKYGWRQNIKYVIYADFEAILPKVSTCMPDDTLSATTTLSRHISCGFSYVIVGPDGSPSKPVTYRGMDATDKFLENLLLEYSILEEKIKENIPMKLSQAEELKYLAERNCYVCGNLFSDKDYKVRDHDHTTGAFRGAAHNSCNLKLKPPGFIPVFLHNLSRYDANLIMCRIGLIKDPEINCIPTSEERYISFSFGKLRFLDTARFMPASLETLVGNLAKGGPAKFACMNKVYNPDEVKLLLRKQVYAYDYMDSTTRFDETELPPKTAFFNSLTDEHITDGDYAHAQTVWEKFNIKNLGEYHDLYVQSDVLLLADIFQNFRTMCMDYYGLDCAHAFTGPGYAWESALHMTRVKLDLLLDPDMHLFIEKGIRGGVAMISHRFAQANNKYLPETYDRSKPTSFIAYVDCNNLYGTVMGEKLPMRRFRWVDPCPNFVEEIIKNHLDDDPVGYILEVDLEYPEHLHNEHNCYPLAPEKRVIKVSELSTFSKDLLNELGLKEKDSFPKLVPSLYKKEKYVIHYRNLKYYLSKGMIVSKVHRVIAFEQGAWLKPYIDFNTEKRKMATNDFDKDFFKLMNNAVFAELEGKEATNVALPKPSLENGKADESQSGKVLDFRNNSSAHSVIEVPNSLSSGRRRRTGVVSMSPQPMQQSVAENLSCPHCKAPVTLCSCNTPKVVTESPNFSGKVFDSDKITVRRIVSKMAGPLNGEPAVRAENVGEMNIACSSGRTSESKSLVGRGPIMSSLPWQAMKREDINTTLPVTQRETLQNARSPSTESSYSTRLTIPVPNSVCSLTMLSSIYGVKPSNVETVLSGLVLDPKPDAFANAMTPSTIDRETAQKTENSTLSVETEVPRTRCHSLPSSSFSIANVIHSQSSFPRDPEKAGPNLSTSVAVSHSSSIQTMSGYSISRTSKLTRPEVIEQHISKIISENAAIVETQDPLWIKRYMRQSSLAADANSDEDSRKLKSGKFRRFSEEVTVKYKSPPSPKFKSKLHSALLGKVDEVAYPYETSPNGRKMSLDSRYARMRNVDRHLQTLSSINDNKSIGVALSKSSENLMAGEKHPENPEGSIIKDLLLKSRDSALRKSPIPSDEDSQNSRGLLNGLNGIRLSSFQNDSSAVYNCLLCNIGFRSKENLEAHKTHYCKGGTGKSPSPNFLEIPSSTTGPVNKRSSSFSFPRSLPTYTGVEFGSGQILKKQLLSGNISRSLSPSKKRKTSEPVFSFTPSDIVFSYPGVLKHGRNSTRVPPSSTFVETGFPSSSTNAPLTLLSNAQQTTTSVSVVVTISKPVLNSGGTVVQYTNSQTITSTSSSFNTTKNLSVPGSVIVSPQAAMTNTETTEATNNECQATFARNTNRPLCLNQALNQTSPSDESSEKILIDAKSDNPNDAKLVKNDSTIAQTTTAAGKMIVPTVILSPCSPLPEDNTPVIAEEKSPKKFLFAKTQQMASRPTSLPLSKKAVTLIGSTIISPETPRPKKKCLQQFINGQAYTTLRLKCSTRSFYCCIYRLQPMYVCQKNQPKLSMYSNWQIYPHKESLFGLTPGQEISLYDTKKGQRSASIVYSSSVVSNTLVVTHSSYWQFRKHEVDGSKSLPSESIELSPSATIEIGKQTDSSSDKETGERVLSTETGGGQVGMESEPTVEGKSVGSECLQGIVQEKKKSFDNSVENVDLTQVDDETVSVSRKYSSESGEALVSQSSGDPSTTVSKSPKRVRIFQGGFRSNEDYTYIRGRGRGKYVCEECGIRCKKPSMLKKHIRTHTDLRPYKCSHCAFAFKTKGNLTKHMKSKAHHKKCLELGIIPVPTTIDDSQIDESALSKQFSDADDEDDDEDLDEDEEESDYDEEDEDSQDHRDDEEMCSSEKDLDGITAESEQFEDAEPIVPVTSSTVIYTQSEELPATNLSDLLSLPLEGDSAWDPEREAARSLLNLSSCGINRINNSTTDWVMSSPVSQIHKSEGSVGSMESLSSVTGCVLSGSEIIEDTGLDNYAGIPRVHWTTVPELSPKSRRRSYSVNMPPARSAGEQLNREQLVSGEHLQTRVISFASSLPVVMEDQLETMTSRRYSMSAIGEARSHNPSSSNVFDRNLQAESSRMNIQEEDDTVKTTESSLPKSWLTINGEQPMDLRITKEPRENLVHLPLSLTPHLWKSSCVAPTGTMENSSITCAMNDNKAAYDVLTSPGSDLMMSPDRNNCGMSDYIYSSGMGSNRLSSGNYFPGASDGEEMVPLEADGSVDMLEASYSSEADDYQHPLSPVSQNSLDNDSQCNHIDEVCGSSGNSSGMPDSYGVKERLEPCNATDRRSRASNSSSQIEFRLSATVPSGSSISTSNHVRIESEGKCSCSICNKTFSKPSQLRLHVNIHYFERPFRCESCAVSFRTKGHLQKHKRSVSHYNKVNMNMTFGTPTTDNPRPFKCGDCKIAFRIHGHLAKHLRSKMHIMKLECLGKLPFGMYAEMERSGVNLNEIDTTDCENSLESLQLMAHRLYQQDPRRMRWHTSDGQAPPQTQPHHNNVHQTVKENEAVREAQTVKMPAPVQYSLSPIPIEETLTVVPMRRSSIISSPIQATGTIGALNSGGGVPHYPRPQSNNKLIPPATITSATNHLVKREPEENNVERKSPSRSTIAPSTHFIPEIVNCASSAQPMMEEYTQPKLNVTVESNVPLLHRSCTCHLCSRVFKSAKFLQVHLYCDHKQQQNQQPTGNQWSSQISTATTHHSGTTASLETQSIKDNVPQWLDCDRTITNGIIADSFSCDICRKQFPTQITLQQHLLTHAQLRPFVCDTCDAGFTSSVMLDTHLATHQQDKNFMCNECGKSFAILVDFQRHVQAHLNDAS